MIDTFDLLFGTVTSSYRKRPTDNFIGDRYLETIVAIDTRNPLATDLSEFPACSDMNLLLSPTARAFHS